ILYYKQRTVREVKKTESRESKLNKKLQREIKLKSFYEKQILKSKQMYYSSINSLNESIFVVDEDLNIILENKALKDLKERLEIEEPTLGNSVDIFSKHLGGFKISDYVLILRTGDEIYLEEVQVTPDIIVEIRKKPVFDEDGTVRRVITVIKDITQTIKNEQQINKQKDALAKNYKQQKLLSQISIIFNSLVDFEIRVEEALFQVGKGIDLSRAYIVEKHGDCLKLENTFEWCNKKISSLKEKRSTIVCEEINDVKEIFDEKGYITTEDIQNLNREVGNILMAEDVKSVLLLPMMANDELLGFIGFDECLVRRTWSSEDLGLLQMVGGIISNAYQRRNMLNSLVDSEQKTSAIINAIPDLLFHLDKMGKVVNFKGDMEKQLATNNDEVIDKNVRDIFPKEISNLFLTAIFECIFKGERTIEYKLVVQDEDSYFEARFEKINDSEVIAIVRNVTQQKKYENELRIAKEEADKANSSKDRLFSIISHDLKHPLADLKALLDLLIFDMDRFTKENLLKCFTDIKETTEATFNLLQDLLQWSRKEMKNVSFEPIDFRVDEIIEKNMELYKQGAAKKGIDLIYDKQDDLNVVGDVNMVDTIIRNLINNAIKFSFKDKQIIIKTQNLNNLATISVKDFGVGIKEEHKDKILSKSDIITTRGTSNEKGTGVGLDLCNDFVKMNNGEFWFESEEGEGSEFFFTLPLKS
ncbi:MAG: ATP-binding protein, partial [Bacteroidales bacterium]|nr:ATP-binding protein [Bacteroidales bacterium]